MILKDFNSQQGVGMTKHTDSGYRAVRLLKENRFRGQLWEAGTSYKKLFAS